jgi:hypothetical protein
MGGIGDHKVEQDNPSSEKTNITIMHNLDLKK